MSMNKIRIFSVLSALLFSLVFLFIVFPSSIEASAEEITIDSDYDISEQDAFPTIGYQGNYSSCVAWSTTYYQFTYQIAKLNNLNAKEYSYNRFSPMYVYNLLNYGASYDMGVGIEECYEVLQELGAIRYSEFNHDVSVPSLCEWHANKWFAVNNQDGSLNYDATVSSLTTALQTRVSSWTVHQFASINISTPITPSDQSAIDEMRSLIYNDNALSVMIKDGEYIRDLPSLPTASNGEKYIRYFVQNNSGSSHALTIVGYDDTLWCDIDNDGLCDAFELGAFKAANSWGDDWGSDGYVWIPYDALNRVSYSSDPNLSPSNRVAAIYNNRYYTISVANYTPEFTVAVTINQNNRMGFKVGVERANYVGDVYCDTVYDARDNLGYNLNGNQIPTDFNGNNLYKNPNIAYYDRVFVFDVSNTAYIEGDMDYFPHERDGRTVYDTTNAAVYGLIVEDMSGLDGDTTVKKIVWKDSQGNTLKSVQPNEVLVDEETTYYFGEFVTSVAFTDLPGNMYVGDIGQFEVSVNPATATQKGVVWSSSDQSIATISSNGQVTAVGAGSVTITATAMDGSGKSASYVCLVKAYYNININCARNQDARRVHFTFTANSGYINANIHIGNREFHILREGNALVAQDNDIVNGLMNVSFSSISGSDDVLWSVDVKLNQPTTVSTFFSEDIWVEFTTIYYVSQRSERFKGCVFWGNHIHYGIEEGTKVSDLINSYSGNGGQYDCYLFNALTSQFDRISYTDNVTNAGTGMVIVRKIAGKVLDAYYIVLYGDVTGGGTIGDGMIEVDDALRVLQHYAATNTITSSLLLIAADANHDGVVDISDAQLIIAYSVGTDEINQSPNNAPELPDDVYFELSWLEFDD